MLTSECPKTNQMNQNGEGKEILKKGITKPVLSLLSRRRLSL